MTKPFDPKSATDLNALEARVTALEGVLDAAAAFDGLLYEMASAALSCAATSHAQGWVWGEEARLGRDLSDEETVVAYRRCFKSFAANSITDDAVRERFVSWAAQYLDRLPALLTAGRSQAVPS